jgi:hypothetical protein
MEEEKTRFEGLSIGAVVLNYNGGESVLKCVQALFKQEVFVDQLILVDNGSTDRSSLIVKENFPEVELIELGENLGISKGRNAGLERSETDLVLLIDDDVYVKENAIKKMADCLIRNEAAVVCPRILLYPQTGTIQCDGAEPHFLGNLKLRHSWMDAAYVPKFEQQVGACIGACMLFDRRVIQSLGNFNEEYFFYFEDLEFSLRVRAVGKKIFCEPNAIIQHERGHGTPGLSFREQGGYPAQRAYYNIHNRWLTILLVYRFTTILLLFPVLLAYEVGTVLFVFMNDWQKEWAKAQRSLWRIRKKVKRDRDRFQKNRVMGDGNLLYGGDLEFAPGVADKGLPSILLKLFSQLANIYWKFLLHTFLKND